MDAVITWVDGNDPALAEKRGRYLENPNLPGAASTRFASVDEVIYCVLSILRFAPFFRRIYIVTDDQTPPVFEAVKKYEPAQLNKIKVVDHRDIFRGYDEYLPVFNSISIETTLHRIPGLAERYVYFNDDVFLVRQVSPTDFFLDGKPILHGQWMRKKQSLKLRLKDISYFLRGLPRNEWPFGGIPPQINAARIAGFSRDVFLAAHVPHAFNRKILENFERNQTTAFKRNLSFRFRDRSQFVAHALANHIELGNNNAHFAEKSETILNIYIDASRNSVARIRRRLQRIEEYDSVKFLCVQSMDQATPDKRTLLEGWLHDRIIGPARNKA